MGIALGIDKPKGSFAEVRPDGEAATSPDLKAPGATDSGKRLIRAEQNDQVKVPKDVEQSDPAKMPKIVKQKEVAKAPKELEQTDAPTELEQTKQAKAPKKLDQKEEQEDQTEAPKELEQKDLEQDNQAKAPKKLEQNGEQKDQGKALKEDEQNEEQQDQTAAPKELEQNTQAKASKKLEQNDEQMDQPKELEQKDHAKAAKVDEKSNHSKTQKEAVEHASSLKNAKEHWPSNEDPAPTPYKTDASTLEDTHCAYGPWTEWSTCSGSCTDRIAQQDGTPGPILTGTRLDANGVAKPWGGSSTYSAQTPVRYSSRDALGLWASYWTSSVASGQNGFAAASSSQQASFDSIISSYWTSNSQGPDMQRPESRIEYYISTGAWYQVGNFQTQNYGVQWLGYIVIQTPGTYTFSIESHDGAELWVWQSSPSAQAQALAAGLAMSPNLPNAAPSASSCQSSPSTCAYTINAGLAPTFDQTNLNAFGSGTGLPSATQGVVSQTSLSVVSNSVFVDLRFFKGTNPYTSMILRYSGPDTNNQLIPVPAGMLRHSPAYHLKAGTSSGCNPSKYSTGATFTYATVPSGTVSDSTLYPQGGTRINGYTRVDNCNTQACPIDCTWTPWVPSGYTQCTAICGGGTKYRNRTINMARFGGALCVGQWDQSQYSDVQFCAMQGCPCATNDCR